MRKGIMRGVLSNAGQATFLIALFLSFAAAATGALYAGSGNVVTTVHYNNARTGWNPNEVTLNIDNVNPKTFGKSWEVQLDGNINLSPLYVSGVEIKGKARNVVYVATASNLIYAIDADTAEFVWPEPSYFLGTPGIQANLGCGSLGPFIGISSTPVIDLETGTLYAVGLVCLDTPCVQGSPQIFEMAAVDITTGESRAGWPIIIDPVADPPITTRYTSERGALLLANGLVYVPFGGYAGDCGDYHGWVVGIDKDDPKAPQLYYRTPILDDNHRGTGIWASGGIAADEKGFIYPATGNSFNAPLGPLDYSNAILRLPPDLSFTKDPADFFMPSNWRALNSADADLGGSAPTLLPPQKDSNTPNMIFITGKAGVGHLLNRDYLGGVAQGNGINGEGIYSTRVFGGARSTPAYYEDPVNGPTLFVAGYGNQPDCGISSGIAALALTTNENGDSYYYTSWCTRSLGSAMSPVVTSAPGETGILWVADRTGELYAYNASTGEELYISNAVPDDQLGGTRNFIHFTVVDGKVFIGNAVNKLISYGLR